MVRARKIPADAEHFIRDCEKDVLAGNYCRTADGYLDFLIQATQREDLAFRTYLEVQDRKPGEQRFYADADHIIPRSVWPVLMPVQLLIAKPWYYNVLTNLFWRVSSFNKSIDQFAIIQIQHEATRVRRYSPEWRRWTREWINCFLATKRE
jgi:hypothetical protein